MIQHFHKMVYHTIGVFNVGTLTNFKFDIKQATCCISYNMRNNETIKQTQN